MKNNFLEKPFFSKTWRPSVFLFILTVVQACFPFPKGNTPIPFVSPYAELKKTLDGGYYRTSTKKLNFVYKEDYSVDASSNKLIYKIFDDFNATALGVQPGGTPIVSGSPIPGKGSGDNRYSIDFTGLGLISGKFYVLEVSNVKEDREFLRFKMD